MEEKKRCQWVHNQPELYVEYHDMEWGVPIKNDSILFEFLVLEGAQAGLSWFTILKRRENYRKAFANFNVQKVANFNSNDVEKLMQNEGIIRNRRKIEGTIKNAQIFINIQQEFGSFSNYIWGFVDGKPIQNRIETIKDLPAKTELSEKISKDLKKRGMTFVGPTIIYAHMQATGMVNDHELDCFRYCEVKKL
ncbi:MAG: DNA-3-methyladenine glycosylase I [Salinivirgaceae bacterium]|nr:DNA-3-methyladenine glycosylase I [Salinivirgaceae bacterium]